MPDHGRSFGDFLKEKPIGGNNINRLKNWKKDGEIVVWIHTASSMFRRLLHIIPYAGVRKDEKTGKEIKCVQFFYFVCHEEVSDYLNRRNSGYPKRCPICRMIEFLKDNEFNSSDIVWEASVGDRKMDRVVTVADMIGDVDKGGDWRLSFAPSIEYVLAVIDDDDPNNGVVVTIEKYSLGEAIKQNVRATIDSKGEELGDPQINPYAFKFVYNSKAKKSTDYYQAYAYEKAMLTKQIQDLLNGPPLNLHTMVEPGNVDKLRTIMESSIQLTNLPIDIFFDNVYETSNDDSFDVEDLEDEPESKSPTRAHNQSNGSKTLKVSEPSVDVDDGLCPLCNGAGEQDGKVCKSCDGTGEVIIDEQPTPKPKIKKRTPRKPKEEPKPEIEYDSECGHCGAPMTSEMMECPSCGARYD